MWKDCVDSNIYGAVLVVYCRKTKRYLLLRELRDKPKVFKKKNMFGFASETKEEEDQSVLGTIGRLVHEELGVKLNIDDVILKVTPIRNFRHKIPVYVSWTVVGDEFEAVPNDTDVTYGGWYTESQIRDAPTFPNGLRIETIEVLDTVIQLGRDALI
ncbi:MAG: hypothetical protein ACI92I_000907 [Acidimicrobiales bacterium]|jgi:hypothetical protein